MSFQGAIDEGRVLRVGYFLFVVAMVAVMIHLAFRAPPPQPANSKAFGCYTSPHAPPIGLGEHGMTIWQESALTMGFRLERRKTGIALLAEAPIAASPEAGGYTYSVNRRGEGWYLDFFNQINGRSYGVFDEDDLRQFTMLATDGKYLPYRKGDAANCGTSDRVS